MRIGFDSAILILTSTSEVLTPAELSIASVLSRTPLMRRLDAAALGHAEIGALADHLAVQLRAGDADGVVGAVADLIVGLVGRAHIGADAAEEQQIGLRLQDRARSPAPASPCRSRRASSAFISGVSAISFSERGNTPPPFEISALS